MYAAAINGSRTPCGTPSRLVATSSADDPRDAYWFGDDFVSATDLEPVLAHVTTDHVKAAAKRFFDERNLAFGVLRPKALATSTAVAVAATAKP